MKNNYFQDEECNLEFNPLENSWSDKLRMNQRIINEHEFLRNPDHIESRKCDFEWRDFLDCCLPFNAN